MKVQNIKVFLKKIARCSICNYYYFTRDKNRKYVFFAAKNKRYSDNQRAISETLHRIDPSIEQIWECIDDSTPSYIRSVSGKLNVFKAMAQANCWVIDTSLPWKPDSIFNIATWHGDRGFKKILFDNDTEFCAFELDEERGINGMDLFLSGSEFGTKLARSAMRYKGEILEKGCPRNDKLLHIAELDSEIALIKENLGLKPTDKIVLYAPTFRDQSLDRKQSLDIDLAKTLSLLNTDGSNWYCLLRAHSISKGFDTKLSSDNIIDVSCYPDMADLLLVTDLLLTDYSSCCCDYALTGKPCILLHMDSERYVKECRTFSVNPESIGFVIVKSLDDYYQVLNHLDSYNWESISNKVNQFYKIYETGESSVYAAQRIIQWLKDN